MISPIQLLDLVSREKLERILRVFTEATGVASIMANVEGRPITAPHNFTPFCLDFCRSTERGRAKCHESDRHGGLESAHSRKPYIYTCLNGGLIDCAAPVIVEGYHLATILAGQVCEAPIPEEAALARARASGITDLDGYLRALAEVPLMTRERLLAMVNLMSEITQTISELALQKYLLHKHSQQYLSRLINSVSDCILSTNADGRITMVNQAGTMMFGYERERILGESIGMLFAEDGAGSPHCKIPVLRSSLSQRGELTAIAAEGSTFPVQVAFSSINEPGELKAGHVWVIRDISEEKRLERMKEDLVGMLTHDLRNPILSLQKVLQLILNDTLGSLNVTQKDVMQLALATCHQLAGMVNDILDIYRNESGRFVLHRTPVQLDRIILDSFSQLDLFAKEKRVTLEFSSPSPPLKVLGDEKRLRRVLVNLLENAIKYSLEEGLIRVEAVRLNGEKAWTEPGEALPSGISPLKSGRDALLLTFTDQGIGIPAEYHQAIFDKYFTIKTDHESRREGVGLGLAFCKQVVEAHGGTIWVESPIQSDGNGRPRGCRFCVTLPDNLALPGSIAHKG